jgi:hypothetical protein
VPEPELELWVGDLARGAQQQAAQREKRQGKKSGKNDLMHGTTIAEYPRNG